MAPKWLDILWKNYLTIITILIKQLLTHAYYRLHLCLLVFCPKRVSSCFICCIHGLLGCFAFRGSEPLVRPPCVHVATNTLKRNNFAFYRSEWSNISLTAVSIILSDKEEQRKQCNVWNKSFLPSAQCLLSSAIFVSVTGRRLGNSWTEKCPTFQVVFQNSEGSSRLFRLHLIGQMDSGPRTIVLPVSGGSTEHRGPVRKKETRAIFDWQVNNS